MSRAHYALSVLVDRTRGSRRPGLLPSENQTQVTGSINWGKEGKRREGGETWGECQETRTDPGGGQRSAAVPRVVDGTGGTTTSFGEGSRQVGS